MHFKPPGCRLSAVGKKPTHNDVKGSARMVLPDGLQQWLLAYEDILWPLGLLSLAFLFVGVVLLPVIVIRLPGDYLLRNKRSFRKRFVRMTISGRIYLLVKNVFGGLLVLAGLVMLVTPGQGLISIAVGIGLLDIPQKHRLLKLLAVRPGVLRTINRFRARFDRPPLHPPD